MAFRTVEPLLATRGSDGHLGVKDVFAAIDSSETLRPDSAEQRTHHICFGRKGDRRRNVAKNLSCN